MIKVGDRVTLFNDMRREATVIELIQTKVGTWFVGGCADNNFVAKIKFDDEEEKIFPLGQLMRLE